MVFEVNLQYIHGKLEKSSIDGAERGRILLVFRRSITTKETIFFYIRKKIKLISILKCKDQLHKIVIHSS